MTMLAEYGTMSLAEVLAPAIQMADGYPMEAELSNTIEHYKDKIAQWPDSKRTILIHPGEAREGPQPGEIFHQAELAATLRKLVEAEHKARAAGKDRKAAIYAGARQHCSSTTARFGWARPASKPPMRRAGPCRSRPAAAGLPP